jgi:hypothetical protein
MPPAPRIGRPLAPGPRRDKQIKILVPSDLLDAVTAAAHREGRSVSDWGMRVFEREVGQSMPRRRTKP